MTRKDYVNIAAAILATQVRIKANRFEQRGGKVYPIDQDEQLRGVRRAAAHLCEFLADDNPRFDRGRFLKACGYGPTTMNPNDPALDLRPLPKTEWRVQQEQNRTWSVYQGEGFRKGGFPHRTAALGWLSENRD